MSAAWSFEMWSTLAGPVSYWLLNALIFGTVLAGVTWLLLATALRKARPVVHGVFWMIVLAKFVIPMGPAFSFSMPSLIGDWLPLPQKAAAPAPDPVLVYALLDWTTGMPGVTNAAAMPSIRTPTHLRVTPTRSAAVATNWPLMLIAAYLAGVLLVLSVRLWSFVRFVRKSRRLPLAGRGVRRLVAAVCRASGVSRMPMVRLSDDAMAPYVFGLVSPTLVLSRRHPLDRGELEAVLFHEIAHLRRMDMAIRYVQWLVGTLLFFWPVVAWVNRRIDLAREHACDEWALRHGRLRPGQYARCLLRAMQPRSLASAAYRPAAMAANISHVERRIEMIMNHPVRGRVRRSWGLLAGAGVLAWSSFVLTGAAAVAERPLDDDVQADDAQVQRVVFQSDDGTMQEITVHAIATMDQVNPMMFTGGDGQTMQFFATTDVIGDGGEMITMFNREIGQGALDAFQAGHPTADADGDGVLTRDEHDAYLVALALSSPDAVIEQFPHSDSDADGVLSIEEAAQLVAGGPQNPHGNAMFIAEDDANPLMLQAMPGANTEIRLEATADGDGNITLNPVITHGGEWHAADGDGEMTIEIIAGDGEGEFTSEDGAQVIKLHQIDVEAQADGAEHSKVIKLRSKADDGTEIEWEQIDDGEPHVLAIMPDGTTLEGADIPADLHDQIVALKAQLHEAHGGNAMNVFQSDDGQRHIALKFEESPFGVTPISWLLQNVGATPSSADVAQYVTVVREAPLAAFLKLNPESDYNHDGVLTAEERDRFIERHMTRARERMLERHPDADANGDGLLTNDEMREYFHSKARNHIRTQVGTDGETTDTMTWTEKDATGGASEVRVIKLKSADDTQP